MHAEYDIIVSLPRLLDLVVLHRAVEGVERCAPWEQRWRLDEEVGEVRRELAQPARDAEHVENAIDRRVVRGGVRVQSCDCLGCNVDR